MRTGVVGRGAGLPASSPRYPEKRARRLDDDLAHPVRVLVGDGEVDARERRAPADPGWSQASSVASAVAPDAVSDRP